MTPLADARDAARFGGKAAGLAGLIAAGLDVPPGFALSPDALGALAAGATLGELWPAVEALGGAVAVRSSATAEDGASHSFAGQHLTVLGVSNKTALLAAARAVKESGEGSAAYRRAHGLSETVEVAAVIQRLVEPVAAGVLFTRDPVTFAHHLVVEAAFGLGEAVVQGLVTPDYACLLWSGEITRRRAGEKDIALVREGDVVVERPVPEHRQGEFSVPDAVLVELARLAPRCEEVARGPADVEWAWDGERVWLVQCRPITVVRG